MCSAPRFGCQPRNIAAEVAGLAAGEVSLLAAAAGHVKLAELIAQLARRALRRADELCLRAHVIFYRGRDQAVVRAAEQYRADSGVLHRAQVARDGFAYQRVVWRIVPALDERHEVRTGGVYHAALKAVSLKLAPERAAVDAGLRGDDAEGRAARKPRQRLYAGAQDSGDGQGVGVKNVSGGAGRGPAGGDDGLHAEAAQQVEILRRHPAQLRRGARAVRHAAGVAEVNYIFIGHELPERSERGQAAEARIEESDGSVVHVILPDYAYLAADKAADI